MKKAYAKYNVLEDGSLRVWYRGYEHNTEFFGFLTSKDYELAYYEVDSRCEKSGYILDSFQKSPF